MKGSRLLPALALLALCGCQSGKPGVAGGIVIGVEVVPHQEQNYALVLTGVDKTTNKPLDMMSGTRIPLSKGGMIGTAKCKDDVCYFKTNADAGDYALYTIVVSSPPTVGGFLSWQRPMTKSDMTKGSYVFHVSPGKFTYGGTYVIYADLSAVHGAPLQTDHPESHIGEHGEAEPTLSYRMDLATTEAAIKDFKGFPTELVPSEPSPITFAP